MKIDDKSISSHQPSPDVSLMKIDDDPVKSAHQSRNNLSMHGSTKEKPNHNHNHIHNVVHPTLQFLIPGKENNKETKVLEEQSTFKAGDTFGQRALFNNGRRKATIITKEPTFLACIDKQHFDLILSK